jgi:branched-chain amino acid transport system ATP-binding protein
MLKTDTVASRTKIAIKDLDFYYGKFKALKSINLDIPERRVTAFIGPSGCGKSTLLRVLNRMFELYPDQRAQGQVLLDGQDITGLPSHALARRGLARTFQMVNLFPELTALENVMQGFHRHMPTELLAGLLQTVSYRKSQSDWHTRAMDVLRILDLQSLASVQAQALPLGQAKLLTVAIAMATQPKLLLLDEPAAGLSHEESSRMMDLVSSRVKTHCTVVLVEHNMRLVGRYCDRAVVLQFGQKIFEGSPLDLVHDSRVVNAYLGTAGMGT